MPSEFLHIPPIYTLVGLYRLSTDPLIRQPVFDKIKHATLRGLIVGFVYAGASWKILRWFVKTFLVGGPGGWFGFGGARGRVAGSVGEKMGGGVWVGLGSFGTEIDLVLCEPVLALKIIADEVRHPPAYSITSNVSITEVLHLQESEDS